MAKYLHWCIKGCGKTVRYLGLREGFICRECKFNHGLTRVQLNKKYAQWYKYGN